MSKKTYQVGRGVDSTRDISLNSMEMSRVHATIEKKRLDYYLIDNFSKTELFKWRAASTGIPYILIHNDNIEMADICIKYVRE